MNYSIKIIKSKAKKRHCGTNNCQKIRTRKPNPLMINFCEVFAGRAMLAGLKLAGATSKPLDYKQKCQL